MFNNGYFKNYGCLTIKHVPNRRKYQVQLFAIPIQEISSIDNLQKILELHSELYRSNKYLI